MGRFILIPGITRGEDRGLVPSENGDSRFNLCDSLQKLYLLTRSWVDIKPILVDYNKWVKEIERKMEKEYSPDLIGFQSRLPAHALKLTVLFAVSELGATDKYVLTQDHLHKGITFATWLLARATEFSETGFIKTKLELQIQRFLALTRREGGVAHSEALKSMHISAKELSMLVHTTVEREEVRIEEQPTTRKPIRFYVSPNNVRSGDIK